MLFEEFVNNKEIFIKELTDFLEVNNQEAVRLLKSKYARAGNYKKDNASEINMDNWMGKIITLYGHGNKKLSETFDLSLAEYNYPSYDGDMSIDKAGLRQIPKEWWATPSGVE